MDEVAEKSCGDPEEPEVILITKADKFSELATAIARTVFNGRVRSIATSRLEPFPKALQNTRPRVLLSFLSPWILPKPLIEAADYAINWHPASRDYPGIGCYNFALYEEVPEYGAICHFMAEKVDTGPIIEERRFPVFPSDSVETLKLRTMVTMLSMFHDTVCRLASGWVPKPGGLSWSRRPFTRRELNELTVIRPDMNENEVRRRIRATTYPGYPGPTIEIGGSVFTYPVPDHPPLA
ncbi:hypothetical protein WV31_13115 [Magnetospirillum sp. ME-1]|uniref:formyltransferase family protein n=1 Tax=Magnetospirillum sp. ME-1 TaxID=1639348 RepID=UPI000A179B64|nr:formyltransferase family protein [Magnetospirillum sp. ME-1]ARJ66541.1 hypothetical protein WV31_13115 [Magnetospirillum sp. ME-1]